MRSYSRTSRQRLLKNSFPHSSVVCLCVNEERPTPILTPVLKPSSTPGSTPSPVVFFLAPLAFHSAFALHPNLTKLFDTIVLHCASTYSDLRFHTLRPIFQRFVTAVHQEVG